MLKCFSVGSELVMGEKVKSAEAHFICSLTYAQPQDVRRRERTFVYDVCNMAIIMWTGGKVQETE